MRSVVRPHRLRDLGHIPDGEIVRRSRPEVMVLPNHFGDLVDGRLYEFGPRAAVRI